MVDSAKHPMPARSNKGGTVRGKARATQVKAMNATKRSAKPRPHTMKPSAAGTPINLPKVNLKLGAPPNITRVVPQINLFGAIGDRLKQVTSTRRR